MAIRVEFYGIARQRAGVQALLVEVAVELPLKQVLERIAAAAPNLGIELLVDGKLHPALTANVDGQRFVSDPDTPIRDGQCLLILSADAGG